MFHLLFDPLEQFEVIPFICAHTYLTNLSVVLFFNTLLMSLALATYDFNLSNNYDYILRNLYNLVRSIVRGNLYMAKQQYFAVLFYLFLTILFANLIGLLPYSFTITGSFIFTLFLSLGHFLGINLIAFTVHRWKFFDLFLPSGTPLPIAPFLLFIEAISYIARVFSLSIRLFANMMAGHALLKIMIGFCWVLLTSGSLMVLLSILPWTIITLVMAIEVFVAILQAYVFTVLVTIYINDVLSFHG